MRVSWLIPARDAARWIDSSVRSALAECGDDDEVIVVDDGSTDGTGSMLPADPRLRVEHRPAGGIVIALEHGRRVARGAFIARLDADDLALPGRIAAQLALFEGNPTLGAVGGRVVPIDGDGPSAEGMRAYVAWVNELRDPVRQLLVDAPLIHPAVLLRKSALDIVGGWRAGDFPEDYDLWLRLVRAGFTLAAVDREVLQWRERSDRLTRTDPRYRRSAFDLLKIEHLRAGVLNRPRRLALCGGRQGSKPWLDWFMADGHEVVVVDVKPGTARRGVPVVTPDRFSSADIDIVFVSIGARGGRDECRAWLAREHPRFREGESWFALR